MKAVYVQQQDQTDCGVACLLSVIRHHGGDTTLEILREQSGTSIQGTSLLGLQQAAAAQNLTADAFEVEDVEVFKREATFPCILHVTIDNQLEHYVVCTKTPSPRPSGTPAAPIGKGAIHPSHSGGGSGRGLGFSIIDPANGFETWSEEKLLERWKSRAVLLFEPTDKFEKQTQSNNRKLAWIKELVREDVPFWAWRRCWVL